MKQILVDAREFVAGRRTGIGRFLEGLLLAIACRQPEWRLTLALYKDSVLPHALEDKVSLLYLPHFPELFWPTIAEGYDLFLSPYPKLPLYRLPCPAVHTVHDVFYLTHPAYYRNHLRRIAATWRLRRALKVARLTWFDSHVSRHACAQVAGFDQGEDQEAVRYPAVESFFLPNGKDPLPEPFFLYVGNGMPHKNVARLLQALEGTDLRLKCVGIAVAEGDALLELYPEISDQVHFLQGVDDDMLAQYYRDATALLLPSIVEGYGYPPLEAMACGTPAIVSDIEVLRETTGSMATYCPIDDAEAWRAAMLLMQDDEKRTIIATQGLAWVVSRQGVKGWQQHIDDIASIID